MKRKEEEKKMSNGERKVKCRGDIAARGEDDLIVSICR
jgi:hypothetical protein